MARILGLVLPVVMILQCSGRQDSRSINHIDTVSSMDGCLESGSGLVVTGDIIACPGAWSGHVANARHLCTPPFQVCSFEDEELLRRISWRTASTVEGCFAYNAAQDRNGCGPCNSSTEHNYPSGRDTTLITTRHQSTVVQYNVHVNGLGGVTDAITDDLAGIGRGCPHVNFGQGSCLAEGRIDASCCTDSLREKACHYPQGGIIHGVLCCRSSIQNDGSVKDRPINDVPVVAPAHSVVKIGQKVLMTCPAVSPAHILWTKNSHILYHVHSSKWSLSADSVTDSGIYACHRSPQLVHPIAHINLTVQPAVSDVGPVKPFELRSGLFTPIQKAIVLSFHLIGMGKPKVRN